MVLCAVVLGGALIKVAKDDATDRKKQEVVWEQQRQREEVAFQSIFNTPAILKAEGSSYLDEADPQELAIRNSRVQEVLAAEVRNILATRDDLRRLEEAGVEEDYRVETDRAKAAKKKRDDLIAVFLEHVRLAQEFSGTSPYQEILDKSYINWCFLEERFKSKRLEASNLFEPMPDGSFCY
jgi:hypothetical protein